MNATHDPAHEAMVVELRMSAGTYVAMIKAIRRSGALSGSILAHTIEKCARPVMIPEDVANGTPTTLPSID